MKSYEHRKALPGRNVHRETARLKPKCAITLRTAILSTLLILTTVTFFLHLEGDKKRVVFLRGENESQRLSKRAEIRPSNTEHKQVKEAFNDIKDSSDPLPFEAVRESGPESKSDSKPRGRDDEVSATTKKAKIVKVAEEEKVDKEEESNSENRNIGKKTFRDDLKESVLKPFTRVKNDELLNDTEKQ